MRSRRVFETAVVSDVVYFRKGNFVLISFKEVTSGSFPSQIYLQAAIFLNISPHRHLNKVGTCFFLGVSEQQTVARKKEEPNKKTLSSFRSFFFGGLASVISRRRGKKSIFFSDAETITWENWRWEEKRGEILFLRRL